MDALKNMYATDVRKVVTDLESLDVPIPKPVTDALVELARVEKLKPPLVESEQLRGLYADPKATRADLDALAARISTFSLDAGVWEAARYDAAVGVQLELSAHVGVIVEALRPAAVECLADLTWYAEQGTPELGALLRHGRAKDAERAANVAAAQTSLDHLRTVRQKVSGRNGFKWAGIGTWRDVTAVRDVSGTLYGLDYTLAALKAGGELWWPTYEEAVDAADQLDAYTTEHARRQHEAESLVRRSAR